MNTAKRIIDSISADDVDLALDGHIVPLPIREHRHHLALKLLKKVCNSDTVKSLTSEYQSAMVKHRSVGSPSVGSTLDSVVRSFEALYDELIGEMYSQYIALGYSENSWDGSDGSGEAGVFAFCCNVINRHSDYLRIQALSPESYANE